MPSAPRAVIPFAKRHRNGHHIAATEVRNRQHAEFLVGTDCGGALPLPAITRGYLVPVPTSPKLSASTMTR